jgi:hypothetical protein
MIDHVNEICCLEKCVDRSKNLWYRVTGFENYALTRQLLRQREIDEPKTIFRISHYRFDVASDVSERVDERMIRI